MAEPTGILNKAAVLVTGLALSGLALVSGLFLAYLAELGCDGSDAHGPSASAACSGSTEELWIYGGWGLAVAAPLGGVVWSLRTRRWAPFWVASAIGGAAWLVLFMLMASVQGAL